MMDSEWVAACLDLGHLVIVGEDPVSTIHTLGAKRLKGLHVQDTNGRGDLHTLPGTVSDDWCIDYESVVKALADIGYDGEFNLESFSFLKWMEPDFMPKALRFMAERARYLADKLDGYRK